MATEEAMVIVLPSKTAVSGRWLLLYPIIVLVNIVAVILVWDSLPDPIPVHFNASLAADRFLPKEPSSLAFIFIFQSLLALVFVGCHFLCKHIDAAYIHTPRKLSPESLPWARLLISRSMLRIGVFVTAAIGAVMLLSITGNVTAVTFGILVAAIILYCIGDCAWMYRRLSRLP